MQPSSYQQAIWAAMARPGQHLVIQARAGSGKTTTLLRGLSSLPFGDTVVTSFGSDIVDELSGRLPRATHVKAKTMHSLGRRSVVQWLNPRHREPDKHKVHSHLRHAFSRQGLPAEAGTVSELAAIIERARFTLLTTPKQVQALMHAKDAVIPLRPITRRRRARSTADLKRTPNTDKPDVTEALAPEEAAQLIFDVIMACAQDTTRYDFTDMIWLPLVRGLPIEQFHNVLVDECQDLSPMQLQFARQLCAPNGQIVAAGDELQAIFQFRGADQNAMRNIVGGLDAETLPLSITYRCARRIVEEARAHVPDLEPAPGAPDGLVEKISISEFAQMVDPGDFVISRANAPLAGVAAELRGAGMPVALLGGETAKAAIDLIDKSGRHDIDEFYDWLDDLETRTTERLTKQHKVEALDAFRDRTRTVRNFALGHRNTREVKAFIRSTHVDKPTGNEVVLSSVHRAKGKETNRVFLLDQTFLRQDNQEERNLKYVAQTRAKTELYYVMGDVYKL